MLKVALAGSNGNLIGIEDHNEAEHGLHTHLLTMGPGQAHGLFKAVSGTAAATTTITSPDNGGRIAITDIMLSAEKKNTGTIELRFTDGAETITIFKAILTDAPIAIAQAMAGLWRGWKDARLEVVTVQDFTYTVACGYIKENDGLAYSDWDARR